MHIGHQHCGNYTTYPMSILQDLDALIEALARGDQLSDSQTDRSDLTSRALDGSLDAALALKDALLPDGSGRGGSNWTVEIYIDGDTGHKAFVGTTVEVGDRPYALAASIAEVASDLVPARALLLATLRAYRAHKADKEHHGEERLAPN